MDPKTMDARPIITCTYMYITCTYMYITCTYMYITCTLHVQGELKAGGVMG